MLDTNILESKIRARLILDNDEKDENSDEFSNDISAGGPDVAAPSVSHAEPVLAAPAANITIAEQREAATRSRGL